MRACGVNMSRPLPELSVLIGVARSHPEVHGTGSALINGHALMVSVKSGIGPVVARSLLGTDVLAFQRRTFRVPSCISAFSWVTCRLDGAVPISLLQHTPPHPRFDHVWCSGGSGAWLPCSCSE